HDRPLVPAVTGRRRAAGRWLVENNLIPDYILCSDALRTRSTCAWVLSELGEKAPTPYIDSRIYSAAPPGCARSSTKPPIRSPRCWSLATSRCCRNWRCAWPPRARTRRPSTSWQ
ncbi:histidine phosphatase family protein, partial [Arthrobacter sp. JCM 19049]|uniref:SixA phosphatase family protein n=1 Tax=Arthrobacter sp. JCM 19049 TaxID=1460643 RepID=UPI0035B50CFA